MGYGVTVVVQSIPKIQLWWSRSIVDALRTTQLFYRGGSHILDICTALHFSVCGMREGDREREREREKEREGVYQSHNGHLEP